MIDPVSQSIIRKINEKVGKELQNQKIAYRRQCPKCRTWLVKEILLEDGCFRCGWKPNKAK